MLPEEMAHPIDGKSFADTSQIEFHPRRRELRHPRRHELELFPTRRTPRCLQAIMRWYLPAADSHAPQARKRSSGGVKGAPSPLRPVLCSTQEVEELWRDQHWLPTRSPIETRQFTLRHVSAEQCLQTPDFLTGMA
jgi:hypothetical protein